MFTEIPNLMKIVRESLEMVASGPVTLSWVNRNIGEISDNYNDRTPGYTGLYEDILSAIHLYLNNDTVKVELWMETENPLLGNVKPVEMIVIGRAEKLLDFIKTQIEENSNGV